MAALEIRWTTVDRINPKPQPVATWIAADVVAMPAPQGLDVKQPICVLVSDMSGSDISGNDMSGKEAEKRLAGVTFKAEKVALALKAFRTIRMDSAHAAADPLLAEAGKEVPRLLVIDPLDRKVTVLEKSRLAAGSVYATLETVANRFYVQGLDATVKSHLSLLTEQDQLACRMKRLDEDLTRARALDDAKSKKDVEALKADIVEVEKSLTDVAQKQRELWNLTPR